MGLISPAGIGTNKKPASNRSTRVRLKCQENDGSLAAFALLAFAFVAFAGFALAAFAFYTLAFAAFASVIGGRCWHDR